MGGSITQESARPFSMCSPLISYSCTVHIERLRRSLGPGNKAVVSRHTRSFLIMLPSLTIVSLSVWFQMCAEQKHIGRRCTNSLSRTVSDSLLLASQSTVDLTYLLPFCSKVSTIRTRPRLPLSGLPPSLPPLPSLLLAL